MVKRALILAVALLAAALAGAVGPRRGAIYTCDAGAPTVRAVGAVASNAAAISPGLPSGTAQGDLLLMFCENSGEGAQTASGWTQVIDVAGTGTRLTVLSRVALTGDATTTNDVGDHQLCRIIGITTRTFCPPPLIFDASTSNTQAATGSVSITGVNSTVNNTLVFQGSAGSLPDASGTAQFASAANASLTSVTEHIDNTVTAGNGGALFVMSGILATAGATGTGTATATDVTGTRANATIVVRGRR